MGLDLTALRFLIDARSAGASFERTITLGRQTLFMEPDALTALGTGLGRRLTAADSMALVAEEDRFCEPVLRLLGAAEIRALDVSAYQGATLIHDLNEPIPAPLHQSCSALVDSGTLEHVFNFPQAVKNCMEMVQVGGHFIAMSPANNFMGHGFYQFSPELFYRVLSPDNGFTIERMLVYEEYAAAPRFFEVPDAGVGGRRVALINRHPAYLLVRARRVADVPIFQVVPQQSDYVPLWQRPGPGDVYLDAKRIQGRASPATRAIRASWKALRPFVPAGLIGWWRDRQRGPDPFDRSVYKEVSL
jgi:hypothetical protein